jgi:Permuted papain-like amidase enzyme, YaeF/YiiX, C92 family
LSNQPLSRKRLGLEGAIVADPLSLNEVERLPVTPYAEIRPKLESGDLLFAAGRSLVSRAIQSVTKSPWSHVGIIFNAGSIDRKMLLESVEDAGVRLAPLTKYLHAYENAKPYDGAIVLARFQAINPEMVVRLGTYGSDLLGQPYGCESIGRIMARIALGLGREHEDDGYICSELVHYCFDRAGYRFDFDSRRFIAPADIWIDRNVTLLARIL